MDIKLTFIAGQIGSTAIVRRKFLWYTYSKEIYICTHLSYDRADNWANLMTSKPANRRLTNKLNEKLIIATRQKYREDDAKLQNLLLVATRKDSHYDS